MADGAGQANPAEPRRWRFRRTVLEQDVIQPYRHVWNVTLARWLDDLAAVVFDRPRTVAEGLCWFIVRQEVTYLAETMQGAEVVATVWIASVDRASAVLEARLARSDGTPLLESTSTWVLVGLDDRRPRRVAKDAGWLACAKKA